MQCLKNYKSWWSWVPHVRGKNNKTMNSKENKKVYSLNYSHMSNMTQISEIKLTALYINTEEKLVRYILNEKKMGSL